MLSTCVPLRRALPFNVNSEKMSEIGGKVSEGLMQHPSSQENVH